MNDTDDKRKIEYEFARQWGRKPTHAEMVFLTHYKYAPKIRIIRTTYRKSRSRFWDDTSDVSVTTLPTPDEYSFEIDYYDYMELFVCAYQDGIEHAQEAMGEAMKSLKEARS